MRSDEFQQIAHTIPQDPGVYRYYDQDQHLLYVGKAKNLRKRVSSYFTKQQVSYKTHELVKRIAKIEFTIVNSEKDAFLLENSLIKQYQPKFNIDLKDDKTYPYLVIKKEPFPRVFLTRKKIPDGSEYLGPFTSAGKVREILQVIKQIIPLRTCKLPLTPANISKGKFKVCLEYHLGNCLGPCEGLQSLAEYENGLQRVRNILKGNLQPVVHELEQEMNKYVQDLAFEKAAIVKKKLDFLEEYETKSVVVSRTMHHADIFTIYKEDTWAYVNYLMVQYGTIVQTHTISLEGKLEESEEEMLAFAIPQLRERFGSIAKECIVPFHLEYPDADITLTVPKGGDKKQLLELSMKNVLYFRDEIKRKKILRLEGKSDFEKKQVLYELQRALQLSEVPNHIECFDNSNFQGSFPVSAMVCFKEGIPSKKDYRHYHIKTVEGINDFASMKEVVGRRYKRVVEEGGDLPQLVIIDGGKGQLGAALEALDELNLIGHFTIVGLAKKKEEIFFPGDTESIQLDWNSESMKLIRFIRDEVHRFGITFHRQIRSKGTFKSDLEQIPGVGKKTIETLLKIYKSPGAIADTNIESLIAIVGRDKAVKIKEFLEKK
jgi:excinuclease ABC subunit C